MLQSSKTSELALRTNLLAPHILKIYELPQRQEGTSDV